MMSPTVLVVLAASAALADPTATDFTASGQITDVKPTVDEFSNALGPKNTFTPENFDDGRRQINWDALPATRGVSDDTGNDFPGQFFNADVNPRARGAFFSLPSHTSTLRLSSDPNLASASIGSLFGTSGKFTFFSVQPASDKETQRIFGINKGSVLDVFFRNPVHPEQQA